MPFHRGSDSYLMGEPIEPVTTSSAGHDGFYWIGEMNKAATVMLVETGIVSPALGRTIAEAVDKVNAGSERPGNYMLVEKLLVAAGGPDVTRVHSGRSRQDMLSTSQRLFVRDQFLDTFDSLARLRTSLVELASRHRADLVPAYTHNVQAQPTTFGHYLSAFAAALERNAERMREAWARINRSPLGAGALGTSSFPIDRARLAELLGFDGLVENAYDANHVAPCDMSAEVAGIASSGALTVGALLNDILGQYRHSAPWIVVREGGLTGTSTMMPQKRNPMILVAARHHASAVLGNANTCLVVAHNIGSGLLEHRGNEALQTLQSLATLYDMTNAAVKSLVLDVKRARAEVEADYSTTTELADVLQRDADVPFRVGHHYASELVNFGRGKGLKVAEIPYAEAVRIYAQCADGELPLGEAEFRKALSPDNMIAASKGIGGPQQSEVERMLKAHGESLEKDRTWLEQGRRRVTKASAALDKAFERISHM
jgi:argininosuccinate lyase